MGKLNYANRKIEGVKLGQVIRKDLVPEKLKRMPSEAGHKAALRDPFVDFYLPGKELGDVGLEEVCHGLQTALSISNSSDTTRLEELCLSGNGLTTAALAKLAPVIELGWHHLRDLDLSSNQICVSSDVEDADWETFLNALIGCSVLRRLDLSKNLLGARGFETLTRVYMSQKPLEIPVSGDVDERSETHGYHAGTVEAHLQEPNIKSKNSAKGHQSPSGSISSKHKKKGSIQEHTMAATLTSHMTSVPDPSRWSITTGLQSIPYLIFSDVSMSDTGALHLSYIVAHHHLPEQLAWHVPAPKPGHCAQQIDEYDLGANGRGIIYLPNAKLGNAALRLFELAEAARDELFGSGLHDSTGKGADQARGQRRQSSDAGPTTGIAPNRSRRRRGSNISAPGGEGSSSPSSELERVRTKIQGHTLREQGARAVNLWQAALHMLVLGRTVLLPRIGEGADADADAEAGAGGKLKGGASVTARMSSLTTRNPEFQTPTTPPSQQGRAKSSSITTTWSSAPSRSSSLDKSATSIMLRGTAGLPPLLGRLSYSTWRRILGRLVEADKFLSEKQQLAILAWASERQTLAKDEEGRGKPEGLKIWRVLEAIGCLSYERRT
ncbi:MAG: hypothetical protein M1817_005908 [Caeruleum heppii]|nr:MAG: hypothetical protein M1817_005908 [Caeruleum heppii]